MTNKVVRLSILLTSCLFSNSILAQENTDERAANLNSPMNADVLQSLSSYLENYGSSSMLIRYQNQQVYQWGDINKKHLIHSMRKPLLNALIGIYVDQGKLSLDATLEELNIEDVEPKLTSQEKQATLRQIMNQRSGIYHPATAESEWMKQQKPARHSHQPGEEYYYNNWNFNVAGAIFEQAAKRSLFDEFEHLIAKPLGMKHFKNNIGMVENDQDIQLDNLDGFYQYERDISNFPAYHFRLSSYDLGLFGQLYANGGSWKGKQIISKAWIDKSATAYSITNAKYQLGYGLMWAVVYPKNTPNEPGSLYHNGVGVHMIGVYPKHNLVFVHRVDTEKPYQFKPHHIYPIINMVFDALPPTATNH
jgi:CubicO group peptidase (beta-lactamase class C family)